MVYKYDEAIRAGGMTAEKRRLSWDEFAPQGNQGPKAKIDSTPNTEIFREFIESISLIHAVSEFWETSCEIVGYVTHIFR